MSSAITRVEQGTTKQFTVTYSEQPGTQPYLTLMAGSGTGTLVRSITGIASSTTAYFAHVTMPGSPQLCTYTWTTSYTAGVVLLTGYVQVIRTIPG